MADLQLYYDDISQQPEVVIDGEFEYVNITSLSVSPPLHYIDGVLTIDIATASNSGILSATDWSTFNSKEPAIPTGTTLQYWRGDKTWQTLNTSVVPENTNLYFTNTRAIGSTLTGYTATSGNITSADTILSAIEKLGYDKHVAVTKPANSGLTLTGQLISMGIPSTCTTSTLNAISGDSHTHAIIIENKSVFFPAETAANYNNRRVRTIAGAGAFNFDFVIPKDFTSLLGFYIVCFIAAGAAGPGKNIDFIAEYTNSVGSLYNEHTAVDLTSTYDLTGYTDRLYQFNLTSLFTLLAANANGGIRMDNNSIGGNIYIVGIRIEYT